MARVLLLALALAAVALPVAAADTPARYTLSVSPEQVDILGRALARSQDPHITVQELITELTQQIAKQQQAQQQAAPVEDGKAE